MEARDPINFNRCFWKSIKYFGDNSNDRWTVSIEDFVNNWKNGVIYDLRHRITYKIKDRNHFFIIKTLCCSDNVVPESII